MRFAVLSLLLLFPLPAGADQSFDCAKAQTRIEKMICADQTLREYDEYLGRYYAAGRDELKAGASCLQSDQAQWLKTTREACKDAACLKTAYLNRLGELDALQPGASALRNVDLPRVPALAWVIAPAADKAAAPPNPKAKPFEATGTILNEVSGGDGFMLQTSDGKKVPIALLMFLESPERLEALAKQKATYRVRGHVAQDSSRMFFEPSRCTYIYRLPQ